MMTDSAEREPTTSEALALSAAASAFTVAGLSFSAACALLGLIVSAATTCTLAALLLLDGQPEQGWALSLLAIAALLVPFWQFLGHHAAARQSAAQQCFSDASGLLSGESARAHEGEGSERLTGEARLRIARLHEAASGGEWLLRLLGFPGGQAEELLAADEHGGGSGDAAVKHSGTGEQRAAALLVDRAAEFAAEAAAFQAARIRVWVLLGAMGVAAAAAALALDVQGETWVLLGYIGAAGAAAWLSVRLRIHSSGRFEAVIVCLAESALALLRDESGWHANAAPDALRSIAEQRAAAIRTQACAGGRLLRLCGISLIAGRRNPA